MANNKDFKVKNGLDVGSTVTLNAYGTGTNTALPTQALNVDENGNVIEVDAGVLPFVVHNDTGATLVKGTVVYVSGLNGNTPEVSLARANSSSTMPAYGLVEEDIADTEDGTVVTFGSLKGLDVSDFGETGITFSLGDTVYISSSEAGKLTNVAPTGEANFIQNIGKIERASPTTNMTIKVGGAGRTNATPNLDDGNFFLGNSSNQAGIANFAEQVDDRVNTLVTDGTGIATSYDDVANTLTFNHSNSVTSGTVSEGGVARQLGYGGAFNIPSVTYDSEGHITATTTTQITLPASDNTDTTYTAGDGLTLTGTDFDVDLTDTVTFTSTNTASKAVVRDASGNFAAGTITADLTGDVTGTVSSLSNHTTDNLTEGSTNLYYADSLVDTHLNQSNPADGYVLSWDGTAQDYAWVAQSGGGGSLTVQDEGINLATAATTLNFTGSGVTASGTGATKTITISGGGSTQTEEHPTVTNGSATVTLANARTLNEIEVYLNGVKLRGGTTLGGTTEWTVSGTTLTFNQNLTTGDEVTVVSLVTATAALAEEFPTVTAGSADVTMSQAFTLSQIDVYLNGVRLKPTDEYTVSGSTLTLGENLVSGDIVAVVPRIEATDATLASLSDTNVTGVSDGELLRYDNSTSKYVPTSMVEDSSGNVDITGAVSSTVGTNDRTFVATDGTQYVSLVADLSTGGYNGLSTAGDVGIIFTTDKSSAADEPGKGLVIGPWTSGTNGIKIQENGNIGIGTSAPAVPLDVIGATRTGTDATHYAQISGLSGALYIGHKNDTADGAIIFGGLGGSFAEKMRIAPSGNVGIGTPAPAGPIDVVSNVNGVAQRIRDRGSDYFGLIEFVTNDGTTAHGYIGTPLAGTLAFFTNGLNERMRLQSGGNLLIGYTSSNGADYKLQVNSQIFATSSTIATSDQRYKENITPLTGAIDTVKALNPVQFDWKEHPVHEFDRSAPTTGFIAQEVQTALADKPWLNSLIKSNEVVIEPEQTDEDGNVIAEAVSEEFLGIAEGNLIAVLTAAIQEQQTQIEAQQATIEALEARLTVLEGA